MASFFTEEILKKRTLLIPSMAPVQFELIKAALEGGGYHAAVLSNSGSEVAQLGLKYVHNDTCYPALLVIGQFLDALESGEYDPDEVALLITQTGGGCRASNYIKLLKKALKKAGYGNVPVASLNFSGLERESSISFTPAMISRLLTAIWYGDAIDSLRNQTKPYETLPGRTEALCAKWLEICGDWIRKGKNCSRRDVKRNFGIIAESFASVPVEKVPKVKVGVVGEIYVKYSPLGNNGLVAFLESQGCEVSVPGLMGFIEYCAANAIIDTALYGIGRLRAMTSEAVLKELDSLGKAMRKAFGKYGYEAPGSFFETMKKPEGIINLGVKMGEGWLLPAEMVELIESGYPNIVCAQPFGCLPNHIAGKGVINRIRSKYPDANITPIDYDPSATRVNQENRIKLMLAVARENLDRRDKR